MLYKGGQRVETGTYWDTSTGERIEVEQAQALPGSDHTIYIKAKSGLILIAGPILGLVFAIFLPFIGIVMSLGQLGRKVAGSAAGHAAQSVSFGWRPIEAYLTGRKRNKEAKEKEEKK
ncbi:MAG: hypothetical protein ACYC7L_00150 [Nitrospirota bacterium]